MANLDVTWDGRGAYKPPQHRIHANFDATAWHVAPLGVDQAVFGTPDTPHQLFAAPPGLEATLWGATFAGLPSEGQVPPAQYTITASWAGADIYVPPDGVITALFNFTLQAITTPSLGMGELGVPFMVWTQIIESDGFDAQAFSDEGFVLDDWRYPTPKWVVNAAWRPRVYDPSIGDLSVSFNPFVLTLLPAGLDSVEFGPVSLSWTQFIVGQGSDTSVVAETDTYAIHWWEFAPRKRIVDASWVGKDSYSPTVSPLDGQWVPTTEQSYISVVGMEADGVGANTTVERMREYLMPAGLAPPGFGMAFLGNNAKPILPPGIKGTEWGASWIYNWDSYLAPPGKAHTVFGNADLLGGVRSLPVVGFHSLRMGSVSVVNTTENRTVRPSPIAAPGLGKPNVSPRTIHVAGIAAFQAGFPYVQFPPSPVGFDTMALGYPLVEFKTRMLAPPGIECWEIVGYPRVFDRAIKVWPPSVLHEGVFGDIRAENFSLELYPSGADQLEMSIWAVVESNLRILAVPGWTSSELGGTALHNAIPSIAPPGIAPPEIDGTAIGFTVRTLSPAGFARAGYGVAQVTKTPEIAPSGFAGRAGVPTVWPRVRRVVVHGFDAQRFGVGISATFVYRHAPIQGFATAAIGEADVSHGVRALLALGAAQGATGRPAVQSRNRTIAPPSIWQLWAHQHTVGSDRFLHPAGFDAARFGTRIIPEMQAAYPQGFAGAYGDALVFNLLQVVRTKAITTTVQPADRWGRLSVWNSRQYVQMVYDPDSGLNPPPWPHWTLVENRTRLPAPAGFYSERFGGAAVTNAARPLLPETIPAPSTGPFYRAGLVAYRVRPVQLEGVEAPYMAGWHAVLNDARVLTPAGLVATEGGRPTVANTRRYYDRVGGFDSAWFGYPMVADAIRTITFERRYAIEPPIIRMPEAKLYTRYVEPQGYEAFRTSVTTLHIHWNIIHTRATYADMFGMAWFRNVTPELAGRGHNSEEFGTTFVRLQWRPIAPGEAYTQAFGRAHIGDKDRTLHWVGGFPSWRMTDGHKVIRTGAPPYSTQNIDLLGKLNESSGAYEDSQGIPIPEDLTQKPPLLQVPEPAINQQVIYTVQEYPATLFGNTRITANSIHVEGWWDVDVLGGDHHVSHKNRRVFVEEWPEKEVYQPSEPRLSPWTIWAVMDAPAQAVRNHAPRILHYVDGFGFRTPGVDFGRPRISHYHRRLVPTGFVVSAEPNYRPFGAAAIGNYRRYLAPDGWRSYRAGLHEIPGTRELEQYDALDQQAFGQAEIDHAPVVGPRSVAPPGVPADPIEGHEIMLFHRTVFPQGYLAQRMGTRLPGDSPYMWRGLRVGPLVPTVPNGTDMAAYGEQWVSFRVREVVTEGFDSFLSEYDFFNFAKRMRVIRHDPPGLAPASQRVMTMGADHFMPGTADIKHGIHLIRPDGDADMYRKGAF